MSLGLSVERVFALGINAIFFNRFLYVGRFGFALVGERFQGGDHDVVAVHFKVAAQRLARVGAAVAVGAEDEHVAVFRQVGADWSG